MSKTSDGRQCSEPAFRCGQLKATSYRLPAKGNNLPRLPAFSGEMHRMMGQNCSPIGADFAKNAFKLSLLTTLGLQNIKLIRINGLRENEKILRGD